MPRRLSHTVCSVAICTSPKGNLRSKNQTSKENNISKISNQKTSHKFTHSVCFGSTNIKFILARDENLPNKSFYYT